MIQRWKGHNSHIKHPILAESAEFVCRKHTWAGRQNHPPPIFWGVGWGAEFICHFWTCIVGQNRSSSRGCIKWGGGRLLELLFWTPIRGQKWYTTPPHPQSTPLKPCIRLGRRHKQTPCVGGGWGAEFICHFWTGIVGQNRSSSRRCIKWGGGKLQELLFWPPRAAIRPRIFDRNSTHTHRDTAHPPCTYST